MPPPVPCCIHGCSLSGAGRKTPVLTGVVVPPVLIRPRRRLPTELVVAKENTSSSMGRGWFQHFCPSVATSIARGRLSPSPCSRRCQLFLLPVAAFFLSDAASAAAASRSYHSSVVVSHHRLPIAARAQLEMQLRRASGSSSQPYKAPARMHGSGATMVGACP